MAQFHEGQRVRIVGCGGTEQWAIGKEATFLHYGPERGRFFANGEDCCIAIDGVPPPPLHNGWAAKSLSLAPLTDPSADRFIERIKKLGKEPINDAPKVTVTK